MAEDALTAAVADVMWERFGKHPTGPLAAWITEQDCRRLADTAMQVVREHTAAQVAAAKAEALREVADDSRTLWEVARRAIEDELVDWRDNRRFMLRNNGFVINEQDGSPSSVIRFGPEAGVRIALLALADHLDRAERLHAEPAPDGGAR